jgi:hypothetical protein
MHVPSFTSNAHYDVKMLFNRKKFDELRDFYRPQRGSITEKGFPKQNIVTFLSGFDFLG